MPTRFRCVIVFAFAFALPSSVFAGPINWSYTSSFHAVWEPSTPFIYVANGGTGTDGSYVLEAALQGLKESGYPSNPGSSPITVGHFSAAHYNAAYEQPPTDVKQFELDVIITDAASGQSGTAAFFGFGNTVITENWMPNPISLLFSSQASQSLLIGKNRYEVDVSINGLAIENTDGGVLAAVSVGPATTPEPSTIALAGFGVFGVMGLRLRRR